LNARAADLIDMLGLTPHPEGGWYRELYRSADEVARDGVARAALTSIYFLLAAGQLSRWHVVTLDEVWHFHEGDPLELLSYRPGDGAVDVLTLGPPALGGPRPQHVVARDVWQAARPTGAYALVGCTVAPGFDFADFRFVADLPEAEEAFAGALAPYADLR
jgi:predicted cupin superfamily sugar epimerase